MAAKLPRLRPRIVAGIVIIILALSCNGRILFDPNGCDQDNECPLPSLHCDLGSGTCVTCTTDAHCVQLGLGFNRCDMALHRCIECGVNADCGTGRTCHDQHCVTSCSGEGNNGGCPAATPHCEGDLGFCILCEEDNNACALASSPGPICNHSVGLCVSCVSNKNCGGTNPRCDTVTGRCVQCLDGSDCGAAAPICDPTTMTCVAHP